MQVRLGDGTTAWAIVDAGTVYGRGRVAPRLAFTMNARTTRQNMTAQIHLLRAELIVGGERLGQDMLTGEYLSPGDTQLTVEIPVDRSILEYFDQMALDGQVNAILRLSNGRWVTCRDPKAGWVGAQAQPEERVPAEVRTAVVAAVPAAKAGKPRTAATPAAANALPAAPAAAKWSPT